MRHRKIQILSISLLFLLSTGCKKSDSAAAAVPSTPIASAPTMPPPPFSAAQKIGMFAYPKNNQSNDQQLEMNTTATSRSSSRPE